MVHLERIRGLIAEQGRTQKWLAGKCGITDSTLCLVLQGHRTMTLKVALAIASALGVRLEDIVKFTTKEDVKAAG